MYLPFDTETSGIADYSKEVNDPTQPHILSVAAILCDEQGKEVSVFKTLIQPYNNHVIDERLVGDDGKPTAFSVNGITQAQIVKYGMPLAEALGRFEELEMQAELKIAHNYRFDGFLLKCAHASANLVQMDPPIEKYCTMKAWTDTFGGKWPKLEAIYKETTGREFLDAHDSLSDAKACKEVFFWLKANGHFKPQPRSVPKETVAA